MSKIYLSLFALFTLFIGGVACSTQEKEEAENVEQPSEHEVTAGKESIIKRKLNSIILPEVNFENITIEEAIQFLHQRSRELDNTTEIDNEKGIKIVTKGASIKQRNIKAMNLRNLPIEEVLAQICASTNLYFRVDKDTATIYSFDEAIAIVENKLDSIIIPLVEFKGVSVSEAFNTLSRSARKLDNTTEIDDEKGIRFIMPSAKDLEPKVINAKFINVSLGKIIRDICQSSNLRYHITIHAVVILEKDKTTAIEDKMNSIILPSVNFENITVQEAFKSLQQSSLELDTTSKYNYLKGVDFVFGSEGIAERKIHSLKLRNAPIAEALRQICTATNLKFKIYKEGVIILPREKDK